MSLQGSKQRYAGTDTKEDRGAQGERRANPQRIEEHEAKDKKQKTKDCQRLEWRFSFITVWEEGRKEGRKEGRTDDRKEERKEERKDERTKGRLDYEQNLQDHQAHQHCPLPHSHAAADSMGL